MPKPRLFGHKDRIAMVKAISSGTFACLIAACLIATALWFCAPSRPAAQEVTPDYVFSQSGTPLKQVGNGTYRRFGFRVYKATLWAAGKSWEPLKPFLLELHYVRNISKITLVESIIDDIRDQNIANDAVLDKWAETLSRILPDVDDGDTLSGFSVPGNKTRLFMNSKQIATIDDDSLSRAFFNMWFGEQADPDLRKELLTAHP
jgi:Chalcone isomerase-like